MKTVVILVLVAMLSACGESGGPSLPTYALIKISAKQLCDNTIGEYYKTSIALGRPDEVDFKDKASVDRGKAAVGREPGYLQLMQRCPTLLNACSDQERSTIHYSVALCLNGQPLDLGGKSLKGCMKDTVAPKVGGGCRKALWDASDATRG